jgi:methylmalonyl-CoA/ethylmalonyl-CoA epimerase
MKPTHIEHIGIAVNSIAEALPFYEKIHHIAFAVDNIEERLREAEAAGVRLIDTAPRKGAEGLSIAFLHPKSTFGVLTELCEDKNSENNK